MTTFVLFLGLIYCLVIVVVGSTSAHCPNFCNGNGICTSETGGACSCYPGFVGVDCSLRVCPSSIAWVDFPTANNTAHADFTECSNMGVCNRTTGLCECRFGFTGPACERTLCPTGVTSYARRAEGTALYECSGNGVCVSLRELSNYRDYSSDYHTDSSTSVEAYDEYDGWDADKIFGCLCDKDWTGIDCSRRKCPYGVDPQRNSMYTGKPPDKKEVQYVECQCESCTGGMYLVLDNQATAVIPHDAAADVVKYQLELFASIDLLDVRFLQGNSLCSKTGSVLQITWLLPRGPQTRLSLIRSGGLTGPYIRIRAKGENIRLLPYTLYSTESTEVQTECSSRGYCDYTLGTCTCQAGYESSDGLNGMGNIPDCGYLSSTFTTYSGAVDSNGTAIPSVNSSCPVTENQYICAGNGDCDESTARCICYEGYSGYDCSQISCPTAIPWFGFFPLEKAAFAGVRAADFAYHGKQEVECAGVGTCDYKTGTCVCGYRQTFNESFDSVGLFTGSACELLACPNNIVTGEICGSHGVCVTMEKMAKYHYASNKELIVDMPYNLAWDAQRIQGCLCSRAISIDNQYDTVYLRQYRAFQFGFNDSFGADNTELTSTSISTQALQEYQVSPYAFAAGDYTGYLCSQRRCPTGDVALRTGPYRHLPAVRVNEVQQLVCRALNGSFTLWFRENQTMAIAYNASAEMLQYRLEQIFTIGKVNVTITGGPANETDVVCSPYRNQSVAIEFLTEHGDLPLLIADVSALEMTGEYSFQAAAYPGNYLMNITEIVKGTTAEIECSHAGICQEDTGQCQCLEGFFSSNGSIYAPGEWGDCSYFNPLYTEAPKYKINGGRKTRTPLDLRDF